ncbi:unnamed protein product [Darwinula stevensoni]|uniref:Uncharacterized protein n=1 Tax=Darwinula stevensoni TaxID=69355 RepID=A0A7R8X805_9CRUS|nr:unnamed protein product [Darwinula stevensoni]CAG0889646.1 unnamed protein product [Darwinula stevensoni]
MRFAHRLRNNFRKEDTMRILFSGEMFDIDGVYNSQNDPVWAVDHAEADEMGGIKQKRKFPQKVMPRNQEEAHSHFLWLKKHGELSVLNICTGDIKHERNLHHQRGKNLGCINVSKGDSVQFSPTVIQESWLQKLRRPLVKKTRGGSAAKVFCSDDGVVILIVMPTQHIHLWHGGENAMPDAWHFTDHFKELVPHSTYSRVLLDAFFPIPPHQVEKPLARLVGAFLCHDGAIHMALLSWTHKWAGGTLPSLDISSLKLRVCIGKEFKFLAGSLKVSSIGWSSDDILLLCLTSSGSLFCFSTLGQCLSTCLLTGNNPKYNPFPCLIFDLVVPTRARIAVTPEDFSESSVDESKVKPKMHLTTHRNSGLVAISNGFHFRVLQLAPEFTRTWKAMETCLLWTQFYILSWESDRKVTQRRVLQTLNHSLRMQSDVEVPVDKIARMKRMNVINKIRKYPFKEKLIPGSVQRRRDEQLSIESLHPVTFSNGAYECLLPHELGEQRLSRKVQLQRASEALILSWNLISVAESSDEAGHKNFEDMLSCLCQFSIQWLFLILSPAHHYPKIKDPARLVFKFLAQIVDSARFDVNRRCPLYTIQIFLNVSRLVGESHFSWKVKVSYAYRLCQLANTLNMILSQLFPREISMIGQWRILWLALHHLLSQVKDNIKEDSDHHSVKLLVSALAFTKRRTGSRMYTSILTPAIISPNIAIKILKGDVLEVQDEWFRTVADGFSSSEALRQSSLCYPLLGILYSGMKDFRPALACLPLEWLLCSKILLPQGLEHPDIQEYIVSLGRIMEMYLCKGKIYVPLPNQLKGLDFTEDAMNPGVHISAGDLIPALARDKVEEIWNPSVVLTIFLHYGLFDDAIRFAECIGDWKTAILLTILELKEEGQRLDILWRHIQVLMGNPKGLLNFKRDQLQSLLCHGVLLDGDPVPRLLQDTVITILGLMKQFPLIVDDEFPLPAVPIYCYHDYEEAFTITSTESKRRKELALHVLHAIELLKLSNCLQLCLSSLLSIIHQAHADSDNNWTSPDLEALLSLVPVESTSMMKGNDSIKKVLEAFDELCAILWTFEMRDKLSLAWRQWHRLCLMRTPCSLARVDNGEECVSEILDWASELLPFAGQWMEDLLKLVLSMLHERSICPEAIQHFLYFFPSPNHIPTELQPQARDLVAKWLQCATGDLYSSLTSLHEYASIEGHNQIQEDKTVRELAGYFGERDLINSSSLPNLNSLNTKCLSFLSIFLELTCKHISQNTFSVPILAIHKEELCQEILTTVNLKHTIGKCRKKSVGFADGTLTCLTTDLIFKCLLGDEVDLNLDLDGLEKLKVLKWAYDWSQEPCASLTESGKLKVVLPLIPLLAFAAKHLMKASNVPRKENKRNEGDSEPRRYPIPLRRHLGQGNKFHPKCMPLETNEISLLPETSTTWNDLEEDPSNTKTTIKDLFCKAPNSVKECETRTNLSLPSTITKEEFTAFSLDGQAQTKSCRLVNKKQDIQDSDPFEDSSVGDKVRIELQTHVEDGNELLKKKVLRTKELNSDCWVPNSRDSVPSHPVHQQAQKSRRSSRKGLRHSLLLMDAAKVVENAFESDTFIECLKVSSIEEPSKEDLKVPLKMLNDKVLEEPDKETCVTESKVTVKGIFSTKYMEAEVGCNNEEPKESRKSRGQGFPMQEPSVKSSKEPIKKINGKELKQLEKEVPGKELEEPLTMIDDKFKESIKCDVKKYVKLHNIIKEEGNGELEDCVIELRKPNQEAFDLRMTIRQEMNVILEELEKLKKHHERSSNKEIPGRNLPNPALWDIVMRTKMLQSEIHKPQTSKMEGEDISLAQNEATSKRAPITHQSTESKDVSVGRMGTDTLEDVTLPSSICFTAQCKMKETTKKSSTYKQYLLCKPSAIGLHSDIPSLIVWDKDFLKTVRKKQKNKRVVPILKYNKAQHRLSLKFLPLEPLMAALKERLEKRKKCSSDSSLETLLGKVPTPEMSPSSIRHQSGENSFEAYENGVKNDAEIQQEGEPRPVYRVESPSGSVSLSTSRSSYTPVGNGDSTSFSSLPIEQSFQKSAFEEESFSIGNYGEGKTVCPSGVENASGELTVLHELKDCVDIGVETQFPTADADIQVQPEVMGTLVQVEELTHAKPQHEARFTNPKVETGKKNYAFVPVGSASVLAEIEALLQSITQAEDLAIRVHMGLQESKQVLREIDELEGESGSVLLFDSCVRRNYHCPSGLVSVDKKQTAILNACYHQALDLGIQGSRALSIIDNLRKEFFVKNKVSSSMQKRATAPLATCLSQARDSHQERKLGFQRSLEDGKAVAVESLLANSILVSCMKRPIRSGRGQRKKYCGYPLLEDIPEVESLNI